MFERGPQGTTDRVSLRVGRLGLRPGPWISLPLGPVHNTVCKQMIYTLSKVRKNQQKTHIP